MEAQNRESDSAILQQLALVVPPLQTLSLLPPSSREVAGALLPAVTAPGEQGNTSAPSCQQKRPLFSHRQNKQR